MNWLAAFLLFCNAVVFGFASMCRAGYPDVDGMRHEFTAAVPGGAVIAEFTAEKCDVHDLFNLDVCAFDLAFYSDPAHAADDAAFIRQKLLDNGWTETESSRPSGRLSRDQLGVSYSVLDERDLRACRVRRGDCISGIGAGP
jgi:hypothetical protein